MLSVFRRDVLDEIWDLIGLSRSLRVFLPTFKLHENGRFSISALAAWLLCMHFISMFFFSVEFYRRSQISVALVFVSPF